MVFNPGAGVMKNYYKFRNVLWFSALFFAVWLMPSAFAVSTGPEGIVLSEKQPDGTEIQLRVIGDEFYRRVETLDGFSVIMDSQRQFVYASLDSAGAFMSTPLLVGKNLPVNLKPALSESPSKIQQKMMRFNDPTRGKRLDREHIKRLIRNGESVETVEKLAERFAQKYQDSSILNQVKDPVFSDSILRSPPNNPSLGQKEGLSLLVAFADDPTVPAFTQAQINQMCNGDAPIFGNTASIKKYYEDQSNNQLTVTTTVTSYIRLPQPRAYYERNDDYLAVELVIDALNILKAQDPTFFQTHPLTTHFDADLGETIVSCFNVFYTGNPPGTANSALWPHSWVLNRRPGIPLPQETIPGVSILRYQISSLLFGTAEPVIGVACHEMGHMLCDFSDYYDYGNRGVVPNAPSSGVGNHCIMGNSVNEQTPTSFNPYLRWKAGWISIPTLPPGNVSIGTTQYYRYHKNATEYYIFQNARRNTTIWNTYLPAEGLAIWHIDETVDGNEEESMTPARHYELSVEQADARFDLERNVNRGDANDYFGNNGRNQFTNTTIPNTQWWDGTASNLAVTNITIGVAAVTMNVVMPHDATTVATPTFDPAPMEFRQPFQLRLGCVTPNARIYYTLDGSQPSVLSPFFEAPIPISKTTTVRAIAIGGGLNPSSEVRADYTYISSTSVASPQCTVPPGNFSAPFSLSLYSPTNGATLYYTIDGTKPTVASIRYSGPIRIEQTTTVRAFAAKDNLESPMIVAKYTYLPPPQLPAPVFEPPSQTFDTVIYVTLRCSDTAATIYYTTDGSLPTVASTPYFKEIYINKTTKVNAVAIKEGTANSPVVSETYTLVLGSPAANPVFSVPSGIFKRPFNLEVSCATPGATLYYTVNGGNPTHGSLTYQGGIFIDAQNTIVKVMASIPGMAPSRVVTATYEYSELPVTAAPTFGTPEGEFRLPFALQLQSETPDAVIRYTLDGSEPTDTSPVYDGGIYLKGNVTVKAFAEKAEMDRSAVVTAEYVYNPLYEVSEPIFMTLSQTFSAPFNLKLSNPTLGAAIYYSVADSVSQSGWNVYPPEGIVIQKSATVTAFASKEGIESTRRSEQFIFIAQPPVSSGQTLEISLAELPEIGAIDQKPKVRGTYTDVNGRTKRAAFKLPAGFSLWGTSFEFELTSKVMLYSKPLLSAYYRDNRGVDSFLKDGCQRSQEIDVVVQVGHERAALAYPIVIAPPTIESIESADSAVIKTGDRFKVIGHGFGKKPCKIWLEYSKNGKIVKFPLRVDRRTWYFDSKTGKSQLDVECPQKLPVEMFLGERYWLVFDTGNALAVCSILLK